MLLFDISLKSCSGVVRYVMCLGGIEIPHTQSQTQHHLRFSGDGHLRGVPAEKEWNDVLCNTFRSTDTASLAMALNFCQRFVSIQPRFFYMHFVLWMILTSGILAKDGAKTAQGNSDYLYESDADPVIEVKKGSDPEYNVLFGAFNGPRVVLFYSPGCPHVRKPTFRSEGVETNSS